MGLLTYWVKASVSLSIADTISPPLRLSVIMSLKSNIKSLNTQTSKMMEKRIIINTLPVKKAILFLIFKLSQNDLIFFIIIQ